MKNILFDGSSHLGQFCITNESVRKGCKNMQAAISLKPDDTLVGVWNDLENGRADDTIWNLPSDIQDLYYPIMDRYFSIMNVQKEEVSDEEESESILLRRILPSLSLYSRHFCARAILKGIKEVHTLVEGLLTDDVRACLSRHGIEIIKPVAALETPYADALLEERYQTALAEFRRRGVDIPALIIDKRSMAIA